MEVIISSEQGIWLASTLQQQTAVHGSTKNVVQVDWMLATELLIDLFFMADIALNLNTGFIIEQVSLYC